jgi:hypothetical protein
MRIITLFAIFIVSSFVNVPLINASVTGQKSESDDPGKAVSPVTIRADKSILKPEGETIRSWEGIGNVRISYDDTLNKLEFECDYTSFERTGDNENYVDSIVLKGNVHGVFNNWKVSADNVRLELNKVMYSLFSDDDIRIGYELYTFITGNAKFDRLTGIGEFPFGGIFEFTLKEDSLIPAEMSPDENKNIFADCIRFDQTGGRLTVPVMTLFCNVEPDGSFIPVRLATQDGITTPLNFIPEMESELKFTKLEFLINENKLEAKEGITLKNGSCELTASDALIDWNNRNMIIRGDVRISREMIDFESGILSISWDEEGKLTLRAEKSPKMSIRIPKEAIENDTRS